MRLALVALGLVAVTGLQALPKAFVPVTIRPGTLVELYVWDDRSVSPFTVTLVRPGQVSPVQTVASLPEPRTASLGGRTVHWRAALVGLEATEAGGPLLVRWSGPGGVWAEHRVTVEARLDPVETISLDPAMTALRSKPHPRKDREAQEIWRVYRSEHQTPTARGPFSLPIPPGFSGSASFGDRRLYVYSDGVKAPDFHRGTDFAVPPGTPVYAPAAGTVLFTADRMLTGQTVVVEHAPGLQTVYFHLAEIRVRPKQPVASGALLGFSGATGLVTGPHLHWELRVHGVPVDPLDLVTGPLLDTARFLAVVSSIDRSDP